MYDLKFSGREEDYGIYKLAIEKYVRKQDVLYRQKLIEKARDGTFPKPTITMYKMLIKGVDKPREGEQEMFEYDLCFTSLQDLLDRTLPMAFKKQQGESFMENHPHKIWTAVKEKYGAVTPWKICQMVKRFEAPRQFRTVESLIEFHTKSRTEVNRDFQALMGTRKELIREEQACAQMLIALPRNLWETITVTKDFFGLEFLCSTLRQKYAKRELRYEGKIEASFVDNEGKRKRDGKTDPDRGVCWYCMKKANHSKKQCPIRKADQEKGIFKSNVDAKPKKKVKFEVSTVETEVEKPLSPPQGLMDKTEVDTDSLMEYSESLAELEITDEEAKVSIECNAIRALTKRSAAEALTNEAVVDSGCGKHITDDKSLFAAIKGPSRDQFSFGNDSIGRSKFVGTIRANVKTNLGIQTFLINDVHYVPECTRTLLCEYQLQQQGFSIKNVDKGAAKLIKKGKYSFYARVDGGVYRLKLHSSGLEKEEERITAGVVLARSKDQVIEQVKTWHMKLGHMGIDALIHVLTKGLIKGAPQVKRNDLKDLVFFCDTCAKAKFRRMSYKNLRKSPAKAPLHTVHMDICGPMPSKGYFDNKGGMRYFLVLVCDFTSYKWIYFIKTKDEVPPIIIAFVDLVENLYGKKGEHLINNWNVIKRLRADGGTEFTNHMVKDMCRKKGIKLEFSNVECQEENGGPERYNQTVMGNTRSLIDMANAKGYWWPEACAYSTYIDNRLPRKRLGWKSAFELLNGRQPNLSHAQLWGTICYAHNPAPKGQKKKLDPRAHKCMLLGYAEKYKAYKLFNFTTQKLMASRDVRFSDTDGERMKRISFNTHKDDTHPDKAQGESKQGDSLDEEDRGSNTLPSVENISTDEASNTEGTQLALVRERSDGAQEDRSTPKGRQSKRVSPLTDRFGEYFCHSVEANTGPKVNYKAVDIPRSYHEATNGPLKEQWESAMQDELMSIDENNTWKLVELPKGRKALDSKWVYTAKYLSSGELERLKARLVVKGFRQREGIDYDEIFSPVARMESLRLLLAIATTLDLEVHQMDVKTAFLNGTLDPKIQIYVKIPKGYKKGKAGHVLRLIRSLYGLKQAPRVWYLLLHNFLTELGFIRCIKEYCMYVRREGSKMVIIVVYVDDLTIAGNDLRVVRRVKAALAARFKMTDLEELHYLLKVEIRRDRKKKLMSLSQERYIESLLKKYGPEVKVRSLPMNPDAKLVPEAHLKGEEVFAQPFLYRNLIGSYQYLVRGSRPDIAYTVRVLSQYLTRYNRTHWEAALWLLGYLKGTIRFGIVFDGTKCQKITYQLYSDASFGTQLPSRKSVLGYLSMLAGACVSYCSRGDTVLATSTMHSEIAAVSEGCKESEWLWELLGELGFKQEGPIVFWCDNTAAINVIENPTNHKGSKAVEIRYLYARKLAEEGRIVMKYCKTEDMIADLLTKPLREVGKFKRLRTRMGVREVLQ